LAGDAVPKSVVGVVVGVAAVNAGVGAVAAAEGCWEVAPKRGVEVGVACSVGFVPKGGLDGVCCAAGVAPPKTEPPAGFPKPVDAPNAG
jgi:hypothetical protein